MTAPTKDEFYAIAFDDVDANLSHEECEEWAEFMTAPTDAETIAALAAQLDTTPEDLLEHAAESVRAPTEIPSPDCEMCEGQPPPVLEGVVQHCEGCSEPETPTTEQARDLATRWAFWHAGLKQCADNAEFDRELSKAPMLLATPERDQLFAWVRARMAWEVDAMMSVWAECGGPAATEDEWRESIADAVGHGLGLSKGDGTKATATAWALCEQSGWPS